MADSELPKCQVCGDDIPAGEAVYCRACLTPHHRDCWAYNGRCSTYGCDDAVCSALPVPGAPEETIRRIEHDEPTRIPQKAFARPLVRLDRATDLERLFSSLGVILLLIAWTDLKHPFLPVAPSLFLVLAAICGLLRLVTDCTYFINNKAATIEYMRKVLWWKQRHVVCHFEDLVAVTVQAQEEEHGWRNNVLLVLWDGSIHVVTDAWAEREIGETNNCARALASHFGCPFVPGIQHHYPVVSKDAIGRWYVVQKPY